MKMIEESKYAAPFPWERKKKGELMPLAHAKLRRDLRSVGLGGYANFPEQSMFGWMAELVREALWGCREEYSERSEIQDMLRDLLSEKERHEVLNAMDDEGMLIVMQPGGVWEDLQATEDAAREAREFLGF